MFPSERIVTPLLPYNVIRRWIRPRLQPLNLGWVTFAVLRRSQSTLHKEKGTDPKAIADQQAMVLACIWQLVATQMTRVADQ